MSERMTLVAEWCAMLVESLGVGVIAVMSLYVLVFAATRLLQGDEAASVFHDVRQRLGRGILLGLEFLVAADIIYTVAVELTLNTVGVLGIIVLIRTFLSFTMEVELTGSWPWQGKE